MLRDTSKANVKPFSFSRVQLSWWSCIVLSAFITILITKCAIPTFDASTLILLGISAGTTAAATVIDISDQSNPALQLSQNQDGQNFFLDILSDKNGVSIHRFQTVVFNIVFGVWFIGELLHNLNANTAIGNWVMCPDNPDVKDTFCSYVNLIIPKFSNNNLILLGLSSGTYAALKATENKTPAVNPAGARAQNDLVPDEANHKNNPAQG
jgi:hypothetical protein